MSQASSFISKLDGILRKFAPLDRTVYKRITSVHPTNEKLIGRYFSATNHVDTLLDPQPYYGRVGREHIPGGHATWEIMQTGTTQEIADDYEFILSPTAVSLDDLRNPQFSLVLKDTNGGEEPFRFLDVVPAGMSGTDVAFIAYFRSLKRPT